MEGTIIVVSARDGGRVCVCACVSVGRSMLEYLPVPLRV